MKELHLICNAHIDPMWQWEWEEGAAAAVSTFRCAADFCEAYDTFIFNHNEALIYQWVEEYEPELFERIRRLVKAGQWNIMGGWFLQPDCNMLSGESFLRQIETGRRYFRDKFGVVPDNALNFDSFGHCRGLVQILSKCGSPRYMLARRNGDMPEDDFIWEGYDGSRVVCHQLFAGYGQAFGAAVNKVESLRKAKPELPTPYALFWGVGDHGGGPSRQDIERLNAFFPEAEKQGLRVFHSTPSRYFRALAESDRKLPVYTRSLQNILTGCYTSQIRLKQRHRLLENRLDFTERMAAQAEMNGLMPYPHDELQEAQRDLLLIQFHDAVTGSSVPAVEECGLQMAAHGMEILSRLRARLFFRLAQGQPAARDGEIPLLIYNPHPYPVTKDVECEFTLQDHHWNEATVICPTVYDGETPLPGQLIKEQANTNLDWRKRVVFRATLAPGQISRFVCRLRELPLSDDGDYRTWKTKPKLRAEELLSADGSHFVLKTAHAEFAVDRRTGWMDRYCVGGRQLIGGDGIRPVLCRDNEDSWGMNDYVVNDYTAEFRLATPEEAAAIAGVKAPLPPVNVIENGAVRAVIEVIALCRRSWTVMQWVLPKCGGSPELRMRVFSDETDTLFKLRIPAAVGNNVRYRGQDAFGTASLDRDGTEQVSQQWTALDGDAGALAVINDGIYGSDYTGGCLNLSLLRNPAYCSHRLFDRPYLPQDRYSRRMDQGGHDLAFQFVGGTPEEVFAGIDRQAQVFNEPPYALCFFPPETDKPTPMPAVVLEASPVIMTSLQKLGDGVYRFRLFNPSDSDRQAAVQVPVWQLRGTAAVPAREVRAFQITREGIQPTDLVGIMPQS